MGKAQLAVNGGSGIEINNGKLEEYYAYGDKIKAQTFVKKYHNQQYTTQISNIEETFDGIANSADCFIHHMGGGVYLVYYPYNNIGSIHKLRVIKYNEENNNFTVGTSINTSGNWWNTTPVLQLDDTHIIVAVGQNSSYSNSVVGLRLYKIDRNNLTITELKNFGSFGNYSISPSICKLDDTHFVVFYSKAASSSSHTTHYVKYRLCTISGAGDNTLITIGDEIALNYTYNFGYNIKSLYMNNNYIYCFRTDVNLQYLYYDVYQYNTTSFTLSYVTTINFSSSTFIDVAYDIKKISDYKFLIIITSGRSTYSSNAIICKVSTSSHTITRNPALVITTQKITSALIKEINRFIVFYKTSEDNYEYFNVDDSAITSLKYTSIGSFYGGFYGNADNFNENISILLAISSVSERNYPALLTALKTFDRYDIKPASSNIYGITKTPATPTKKGKIYSLQTP